MSDFEGTPAAAGFYLPPEWVPHERSWLAWPTAGSPWLDAVDVARASFADFARQISLYEPVSVVAAPWDAEDAHMTCGPSIDICVAPLNGCWARDFGPSFLTNGEDKTAAVAWRFNGYGNRSPHDLDEYFAEALAETLDMKCYQAPLVLEGGAFQVDEVGTLVTTEKVVLSKNRNPTLSLAQIEERLVFYLGARKIIWLAEGLEADRANDGHINNVMRFAPGSKVLLHTPAHPFDPDSTAIEQARRVLTREARADGKALEIIDLPAPDPGLDFNGEPAARSYTNFYLANSVIFVPGYDCSQDEEAAQILGEVFHDREVVQIDAGPIVFGGGGLHRMTQPQPKGAPQPK